MLENIRTITSLVLLQAIFGSTASLALENPIDSANIQNTSIQFGDTAAKAVLLASIPAWQPATIKIVFDAYRHPEQYKIPKAQSTSDQGALFIHAFFGPLDNPFTKYPRPAKAFVIFPNTKNSTASFEMAPIIHDLGDGNYYVFDANQISPILLDDWIAQLKTTHPTFLFNICNGYGTSPMDSCMNSAYQDEAPHTMRYSLNMAAAENPSAHRDQNESWQTKIKSRQKLAAASSDPSIYDQSIAWSAGSAKSKLLQTVVTWPNHKTIQDAFEKIRDPRYFQDNNVLNFKRRITWLYPDDGCWTRAAAVIKDFFGPINNITNTLPRPSKLFAFGNLCVNTQNSRKGSVSWWYHTAPIVKDAETNISYVLDPSVDIYNALPLDEWMARVSSNTEHCAGFNHQVERFAICNGYGSTPYDSCNSADRTDYGTELSAMRDQYSYRQHERERQTSLGRDADKILGDSPPWKTPQ
jgi:hypothetical protein